MLLYQLSWKLFGHRKAEELKVRAPLNGGGLGLETLAFQFLCGGKITYQISWRNFVLEQYT